MKEHIKRFIKSKKYLTAILYILNNARLSVRRLFHIITESGATHSNLSLLDSISYIENVFSDYQKISGISRFTGKIAEIGPGDSSGVALMFLANGANHVDLADRFYSVRSDKYHAKVYKELASRHPILIPLLDSVNLETLENLPSITRYYGDKASGELFFEEHKDYDVIISRSVLEHVSDPELVLNKMYEALKPGGVLIHKVDLRDHGIFTPYGSPTKFLEIPSWIYKVMTYKSGYPNRFLFHDYKKVLRRICPDTRFYITGLHNIDEHSIEPASLEAIPLDLKQKSATSIEQNRPNFAKCFRTTPSEDLMVSSFFFVCTKSSPAS